MKDKLLEKVTADHDTVSRQAEPQWIHVSERLPEKKMNNTTNDFESVLCSTTFGDVRMYTYGKPVGWREPHFWNGPGIMDEYVIAWMEKPEPYI